MKLKKHLSLLPFLLAGAALFLCETALARAGGGGGFSGGGGGGFSGGGGDSDGLGILVYILIRLIIERPLVGIPVAVMVAVALTYSARKANSANMSRTIRHGHAAAKSLRLNSVLAGIETRDPAFDPQSFCRRCAGLLPAVQNAWCMQDMTPVRHFISDGVHERFALQLEMQKASGIRNVMENVEVLNCRPVDAAADDFFDTIHIAVTARAIDRLVKLESNRIVQGSASAETFTEIWTFLRRPGAKTLERPGLLEGFCPNCGARLEVSMSTTCDSCGALINSGEYDWVLSEITQEEVWRPRRHTATPGLAELRRRDPGFNTQALEDRASAIFWHHRAAEFFAQQSLLNAVALPQFTDREKLNWVKDEEGRHRFYADAAVGSVDLAEVIPAKTPDEPDRVRVLVEWSGHRVLARVPGFIKPQWHLSRLMRREYMLIRQQGVQSVARAALTSLHCPGCGAPQVADSTGECRYCGLRQNDGGHEWVLESVGPFSGFATSRAAATTESDPPGLPSLEEQLSLKERESVIQCLSAIMLADSVIDPQEDRQLKKMAARHGIAPQRLYELVHQVQTSEEVDLPELSDFGQRSRFFRGLVRMCLADGSVSSGERRILKSLVSHLGYSDIDINTMINRERSALYLASKRTIKAGRKKSD